MQAFARWLGGADDRRDLEVTGMKAFTRWFGGADDRRDHVIGRAVILAARRSKSRHRLSNIRPSSFGRRRQVSRTVQFRARPGACFSQRRETGEQQ
jgi:hypothetical protein